VSGLREDYATESEVMAAEMQGHSQHSYIGNAGARSNGMSQETPDIDHTIPSLIDDIYAGALDDYIWTRASIAIGDSVGATGIHLFSFNSSTNNLIRDEAHRIDPQLTADYRDYYCTKDILFDPFLKIAVGEVAPEHKLVSLDAWRKCELFNDLAVPYDMPYILTALLHRSSDKFVFRQIRRTEPQNVLETWTIPCARSRSIEIDHPAFAPRA
jgi:hypothetical protein